MNSELKKLNARLHEIDRELIDLFYANKTGTFDIGGKKRRMLSDEWVFVKKQINEIKGVRCEFCGNN